MNARISYTTVSSSTETAACTDAAQAGSLESASRVRVIPKKGRGKGEIVPLDRKIVSARLIVAVFSPHTLQGSRSYRAYLLFQLPT